MQISILILFNPTIEMKFKKSFSLILLLSTLWFSQIAIAQNYANTKVDELSDTQIRQMMQRANSMGYTDEQLTQLATAQGMNANEITKLRSRVEKLRKESGEANADNPNNAKSGNGQSSAIDNVNRSRSYVADGADSTKNTKFNQAEPTDIFEGFKPKVFGSDLFKNGNITFEPNLRIATPKSYIVGPDDKLLIDLTGDNEANYNLAVSTEGAITLPYVGRVTVGGLSIEQATAKIRQAMRGTYPALSSGRTNLAINLGNIRSIKVTITGQAVKTGTYTISSLSSVYNALNYAGGPALNGSYRNIKVIRNNKQIATVDVYDFITSGIQKGNIRLQDQDVIHIPAYDKRVEIKGEIKIPALFELRDGESLQTLINFAAGFTSEAYTAKVKALQKTAIERQIADINASEFASFIPGNGDQFIVEQILDRFKNRVEIAGAVFRPGQYELESGLTLKGLIQKADGLTEDAFLNRAYINRLNADQSANLISFDVAKVLAGTSPDIVLLREDRVTINSIFDLREEFKVTIQGEVRAPGEFDYASNLKLADLIQMAGGFKESATPNRIEIARRVKNADPTSSKMQTATLFTVDIDRDLKLTTDTFTLQPFDIVSIRNSESYVVQKQVKLEGEVLYPGMYTITNKNDRISDLIKRAGGLTASAYADGASLKRPGAKVANPLDKNAINQADEEERRILGLKRAQEAGVKDTLDTVVEQKLLQSDLVGINLVRILERPQSTVDLFVEDGDVIRVPKQLQTVKVSGEVLNPNSIVFLPGKSLKQYINGSGGFTSNARKNGVYVNYANGSSAAVGKFLFFNNYPVIKPGAEILVPKRAERERISPQAWIGIGTALASLGAIIVSILR